MRELVLDGSGWSKPDDLYEAFFRAVGAPPWHGRNFNALIDSIGTGQINEIEVPYCIVIRNYDRIGLGAVKAAADFVSLIGEIKARAVLSKFEPKLQADHLEVSLDFSPVAEAGVPVATALWCEIQEMPHGSQQVDATLLNIGCHSRMCAIEVAYGAVGVAGKDRNG
jgi:hypothetical protein